MKDKKIFAKDGIGYIEFVDSLGTDLTAVNAAKVSFNKQSGSLEDKDIVLLEYLKEHNHTSPFRHMFASFIIYAPEFVMRQWFKHVVGIEATSSHPTKDTAWNEASQRYVDQKEAEFYIPSEYRKQSNTSKQCSDTTNPFSVEDNAAAQSIIQNATTKAIIAYNNLRKMGVAREQARLVLPLNIYTKTTWTASFQAIMNLLELRISEHAQPEIQEYAKIIEQFMYKLFPTNTNIWRRNVKGSE